MLKLIKILTAFFLIISLITLSTFTFAVTNPDEYEPNPITDADIGVTTDLAAGILLYIRYIGIILAAIVLSVIGLKYLLASTEEKASYKENMIPYIVGCLLLMAGSIIPGLVYQLVN